MKKQAADTLNSHISVGEIYEGGALNGITISDLIDNKTAITQLVNDVNIKNDQIAQLSQELSKTKESITELRAKSSMRWYDAAFNTLGAIVMAIGTNLLSCPDKLIVAISLICVGGISIGISNVVSALRAR